VRRCHTCRAQSPDPYSAPLPGEWAERLGACSFLGLCLVRVFRCAQAEVLAPCHQPRFPGVLSSVWPATAPSVHHQLLAHGCIAPACRHATPSPAAPRREEALVGACSHFVAARLGREFVEPAPWSLEDVFPDTSARTPTVFILSPGAPVSRAA
jgi:hypothetical protein